MVEVRREIAAPPSRVWAVLTDAARLGTGGFGILRIEGEIRAGGKLKLWSVVDPRRAFGLRVTAFEAPRRMVWSGGMPLGLFRGVRTYTLTPSGAGTSFHMSEVFSGPLAGMITRSMPDLQPSFEMFGDALKREAEA